MSSPLAGLGVTHPVLAAPMAGGPSTVEFVVAAGRAGSLGFLAGGYKDVGAVREQVAAVRAAGVPYGVNLFAPNPVPIDEAAFREYARLLQPEADAYGIDLNAIGRREDDDQWDEKIDFLLAEPVPVVSFTFGIPAPRVVAALRKAGTLVVQTVTSAAEARLATESGADLLAVQASAAGGHSGTLTPGTIPAEVPLTDLIRQVTAAAPIPAIGAGGVSSPGEVAATIAAGALAVVVGTVLLRAEESGASAAHKAALADPAAGATVVTRAFTGRPTRALANTFTERYSAAAPAGYPAVHHLTSPLRKAATAAGHAQRINLWAGTGYKDATDEPVGRILARLAAQV